MAKKARKNIAAQTSPYVREKEHRKWTWSIAGFVFLALLALYLTYPTYPQFDGLKAYQYLEEQCAFGPRVPGNNAHQRCGDYLTELLKQSADKVQTQWFEYRDRKDSTRVFRGEILLHPIIYSQKRNIGFYFVPIGTAGRLPIRKRMQHFVPNRFWEQTTGLRALPCFWKWHVSFDNIHLNLGWISFCLIWKI